MKSSYNKNLDETIHTHKTPHQRQNPQHNSDNATFYDHDHFFGASSFLAPLHLAPQERQTNISPVIPNFELKPPSSSTFPEQLSRGQEVNEVSSCLYDLCRTNLGIAIYKIITTELKIIPDYTLQTHT